jgi:hypothetical protein
VATWYDKAAVAAAHLCGHHQRLIHTWQHASPCIATAATPQHTDLLMSTATSLHTTKQLQRTCVGTTSASFTRSSRYTTHHLASHTAWIRTASWPHTAHNNAAAAHLCGHHQRLIHTWQHASPCIAAGPCCCCLRQAREQVVHMCCCCCQGPVVTGEVDQRSLALQQVLADRLQVSLVAAVTAEQQQQQQQNA